MARIGQHSEELDVRQVFETKIPIDPPPPPVPERGLGSETRMLLQFMYWGVVALYYRLVALADAKLNISSMVDSLYDLDVIENPSTYSLLGQARDNAVTPGTPLLVYTNAGQTPVTCHIRLETYTGGVSGSLIVDDDQARCTAAKAKIVKTGPYPSTTVIVKPNGTVYADCSDSSGGAQLTFNVVVVPQTIPRGKTGALGGTY